MSGDQLAPAEKETLQNRLDWTERVLAAMLAGDKPAININAADEKWLYDQLTRMYAGHYLSSPANSYATLPGEGPAEIKAKGDTRYHPLPSRFVLSDSRKARQELENANIHNFHILGTDDQPAVDADHHVLTSAALGALHQAVTLLRQNLDQPAGQKKLVVLQSRNNFWDHVIVGLDLGQDLVRQSLGVAVTSDTETTKNAILFSGKDIQKTIAPSHKSQLFPQGMEMQFGSTQPKKADETGQIILHENMKAGLRDAVVPLHWFLSADEVSKTYEGNGFEKIESMMLRIYEQIGYEEVCKRLRDRGYDPERTVFVANDTGWALSSDFSQEPEFSAAKAEAVPGKPWPDVELGPVVDAMGGITRFMDAVQKCYARKGLSEPLRYRDTQLYMLFKLVPERKDVKIHSYFGTSTGYVTFDPRPNQKGSLYTEHFCVPDGQPEGIQGKTQAELGSRYLLTDSPQARTVRAIAQDFNVPKSLKPLFDHHAKDRNHRNKLRLLTQDNWLDDVRAGSGGTGFARLAGEEGWKLSGKKYDAFEDYAEAADAIYLGAHSRAILDDYEAHNARLSLLFCKAGTHKQILHDVMYGKSLMIANPDLRFFSENGATHQNWADPAMGERFINYLKSLDPAEHPWGRQLLLYRYFHENSLIKQQPKYIWTQVEGQPLSVVLREARDNHASHKVTRYTKEEYGDDRHDLFSMTVLGSASTRSPLYTDSAYYLGYEAGRAGMHGRSGGGRYGIMGAFSRGMMDYQDTHPQQADCSHLSAIQMPRTVQFEGLALDISAMDTQKNRYVAIEPGMDPRMISLFRSDVMIADAGGLGTLEELFYFISLKQAGHPVVKDKPMIIINHAHLGPEAIRLYDPVLATLSAKDRKDIHVVTTPQEAMELVLKFRKEGYKPRNPASGPGASGEPLRLAP
ncbi:MAG: LOG family protein [Alphaproteobacteria bacterium]|nr:LOG family protein [Alphaproteobacteria bacterium]